MKNKFFTTFLFSGLLFSGVVAQNAFNCNSHEQYQKQMQQDASFKKNQEQLEQETKALIANMAMAKPAAAAPYIIPVVFHVIYTTAYGNISDAQIIDQVAILNKEFNRQQADTLLTPSAFLPVAGKFNVEFRLATLDPNGNCTNGINRVYSTLSNCSVNENDVKAVSYWPSNMYLNIWLTQSMHYSNSTDCGGGGYATFPGGAATNDGINIRGDLIGNIGTAATNSGWGNFKGRYLIHELGHWFNLRHIWGDAICGNDQVADTPPAVSSNSSCPVFPRNPFNSCGSGASGEMFTNYMDYTNGPCLNMFTAGQVTRMTAALSSSISGRNNLWSTSNLNATGTNNPYTYPVACASEPDVLPLTPIIACVDDSVLITDNSYGGSVSSRVWNFGNAGASSLSNGAVKVKYSAPGVYSFTLTNNYLSSSKTRVFSNKVYILPNVTSASYVVPFTDSFEDVNAYLNDWTVVDRDNDAVSWEITASTAYTDFNSIYIANFDNRAPTVDEIISPPYNLSAVENPTLTFMLHSARRTTTDNDQLQVFISNNCGATWNSIYFKSGSALKTILANQASSYTPAVTSADWRLEKINIQPFMATGIVHFKFAFTGGGGNNIFIDDINLDGINTTGLKSIQAPALLRVFPNPANNYLNVKWSAHSKAGGDIDVVDVLGRSCLQIKNGSALMKENTTVIDIAGLENGVYFINLRQNGQVLSTTKFVKQSAE
ncbi:MAG: choice-of-anchor J domain-containing protein [Bacteroidia bacterium]|nr:choice-of-anchor J domain-containing protein [Bacteroidia bacterium]